MTPICAMTRMITVFVCFILRSILNRPADEKAGCTLKPLLDPVWEISRNDETQRGIRVDLSNHFSSRPGLVVNATAP